MVTINHPLQSTNRVDIRKEMIDLFLNETAGTGKGNLCSKYQYDVEQISNTPYSIFLIRPARLNKGIDFTVHVGGGLQFKKFSKTGKVNAQDQLKFKIDSVPRHDCIEAALQNCTNNANYNNVKTAMRNIYNCQQYNMASVANITFNDYLGNAHPIEIILLAAKWLFIEQDITYWNHSGRAMLWNGLAAKNLV